MIKNIEITHEDPLMIPSIEWQLEKFLGYKKKVWEILSAPQDKKEEYCRKRIYIIIAKRSVNRALSRKNQLPGNQK